MSEPSEPFSKQADALMDRACTRINEDCCRTLFTDADEFCEELRAKLDAGLPSDDARAEQMTEIRDRLEGGCCQTGFHDAMDLVDDIDAALKERG